MVIFNGGASCNLPFFISVCVLSRGGFQISFSYFYEPSVVYAVFVFVETPTVRRLFPYVRTIPLHFVSSAFYGRAVARVAVVDMDSHLATGTADILCRTLDPAFLYASIAPTGNKREREKEKGCKSTAILDIRSVPRIAGIREPRLKNV